MQKIGGEKDWIDHNFFFVELRWWCTKLQSCWKL